MGKYYVLFLLSLNSHSSTLFMPDSDTAALISLVSNTASTVSNTLKILEVAEKTSSQIDQYNFLAMRRYFIARRIEQHARDITESSKMSTNGLKELNQVMRRLKMNLSGLKSNIDFVAQDLYQAQDFTERYYEKLANSITDEKEAHNQEILSASAGSMSKHVQNTAMNIAMSTKILAKSRRENIEFHKNSIALKKAEITEDLRKEEFYKKWLGLDKKEEI